MAAKTVFVNGVKTCTGCGEEFPPDGFHKTTSTICGRTAKCKSCRNASCRKWSENNPERRKSQYTAWVKNNPRTRKNSMLMYVHKITIEQYDEMFLAQGGVCAICKQPKRLCVDHCHRTGKVRGLLCDPCNITIGKCDDDIQRLEAAIAYLKDHYGK